MCSQWITRANRWKRTWSFGEVDEVLYSVRPDESGDIVAGVLSQAQRGPRAADFVRVLFRGAGGVEESAVGALGEWDVPSAAGSGEAGVGFGGAQGAQRPKP